MPHLEPRLLPPQTRGHVSVARLAKHWYVACRSGALGRKVLRREILGTPVALFRDRAGRAGALLDRCPHRNVPLSLGRVVAEGHLECSYHGWQFDVRGVCRLVPGLSEQRESRGRNAPAFATRERDGLVWIFGTPDAEPEGEPFALPLRSEPGYISVVREVQVQASVHATAENALDVPHTAYLHGGLFRTAKTRNRIDVEVRRWSDRVEAEYIGEPRPPGIVGKLLSPSGGVVQHWDRFILPSITQVEYRLGPENHVVVTALLTPVTDFVTRLTAVISLRVRIPGFLLKPVLSPLAMRIFRQDADILKTQTETIRAFGGEQYVSTDADVLGREIWRLLNHADRGVSAEVGSEPVIRRLQLLV